MVGLWVGGWRWGIGWRELFLRPHHLQGMPSVGYTGDMPAAVCPAPTPVPLRQEEPIFISFCTKLSVYIYMYVYIYVYVYTCAGRVQERE